MTGRRLVRTLGEEPPRDVRIRITADRAAARAYLERYTGSRVRLGQLRVRRRQLMIELREPAAGVARYSLAPGHSGEVSDPTAAPTMRLSEVEDELERQIQMAEALCAEILGTLDVLPLYCRERQALELRYIDGVSIERIQTRLLCARPTVFNLINNGLDLLMADPATRREIIKEEAWKK